MELQHLGWEQRGHVVTWTLNRPDARNAYSDEMVASIIRAADLAEADDSVRCVVLTGAGRSFSAGGDLKAMQSRSGMFAGDQSELRHRYAHGIQEIPRRLCRFEKPLIAAVNGAAIGAGLDLACMCDFRIAAKGARFGSTFVRLGLVPGDGGAFFLTRAVGYARAMDLILSGRIIDTIEAERIGLVQQVVEEGGLLDAAHAYAGQIAANAPVAVRLAKSAVFHAWQSSPEAALNLAATYQSIVQHTADHEEGVAALLEKRSANFGSAS